LDIELLPKQHEFLTSDAEEVALVSGIGFGKTTAGSLFAINETAQYPDVPGIIVATTYSQLTSATLNNLSQWCELLGIYYKYNSYTKMVTINNTQHFVRSAENYDASRGIEGGWLYCDESAYISEPAIDMFLGRIRYKGGSLKKRYTSSPNGFNSFYHRMHPAGDNYDIDRIMIQAKTEDNYFLPKGYIQSLRKSYSSKMAAQELDADFISMAGLNCYSDFDRKKHVTPVKQLFKNTSDQQLYVFMDYNVEPFCAVVGFMYGSKLLIIDEIYLEGGADVRMMAREIKKRYSNAYPICLGDGTGNNKRSIINIKQTAYKVLQEEGLRVEKFANPHVAKRLGNVNRLLFHNLLIIDPTCTRLIKDLELVVYAKNSNDIDKKGNQDITHVSDALGYLCHKLLPFTDVNRKSRQYQL